MLTYLLNITDCPLVKGKAPTDMTHRHAMWRLWL